MYLPGEALGLRVEDDYWVGAIGLECLSCPLPRWPEEIEAVIGRGTGGAGSSRRSSRPRGRYP